MTDTTYNGWANYATWRVNLEMIDGLDPREMGWRRLDKYELAGALKDYCDEMLECNASEGLALDYARAFVSDVNWYEIAAYMIEAYADASDDESDDVDADCDA
jgi:hypothetical protein